MFLRWLGIHWIVDAVVVAAVIVALATVLFALFDEAYGLTTMLATDRTLDVAMPAIVSFVVVIVDCHLVSSVPFFY